LATELHPGHEPLKIHRDATGYSSQFGVWTFTEPEAPQTVIPAGSNPVTAVGDVTGDGRVDAADTVSLPAGAPGRSAPKARWVEYFVSLGMDPVVAESATKEDLIRAAAAPPKVQ
jgi:hypothetical protein